MKPRIQSQDIYGSDNEEQSTATTEINSQEDRDFEEIIKDLPKPPPGYIYHDMNKDLPLGYVRATPPRLFASSSSSNNSDASSDSDEDDNDLSSYSPPSSPKR